MNVPRPTLIIVLAALGVALQVIVFFALRRVERAPIPFASEALDSAAIGQTDPGAVELDAPAPSRGVPEVASEPAASDVGAVGDTDERVPAANAPPPDLRTQFLGGIPLARKKFEDAQTDGERFRTANILLVVSLAAILEATGRGDYEAGTYPPDVVRTGKLHLAPDEHHFSLNGRDYTVKRGEFPEYDAVWDFKLRNRAGSSEDDAYPGRELYDQILARAEEALRWADSITR